MLLLQATGIDPNFKTLALVIGWTLTILVGAFALVIIYKIILGHRPGGIDLKHLLAGDDGYASLARFQFLIFTFVIALCLFLIIVHQASPTFPPIPGGILALLGISGGSYVVAKGVDAGKTPTTTTTIVSPNPEPMPPTVMTEKTEPKSME
jgi:FtsH-binding integral membrane protein